MYNDVKPNVARSELHLNLKRKDKAFKAIKKLFPFLYFVSCLLFFLVLSLRSEQHNTLNTFHNNQ